MAANTDKFRKKKSQFSTTIPAPGIDENAVTIPLLSSSGLATDTAITLTLDRIDSNGAATPLLAERVTGVISGTNLTNVLRGQDGTTAVAHAANAVVEDTWDADTWNDAIDAILEEHDQDGGHNDITATTIVTSGNADVGGGLTVRGENPATGWFKLNESWTYLSANTITVPSGAASRFKVGGKLKISNTSTKYFSIVGIADTVLTVTGGSDYTVANAAISNIYYSAAQDPVGFPDWFNFTSTVTGFSDAPTVAGKFRIVGKECKVYIENITGTSNATTLTFTVPVALANSTANLALIGSRDNGSDTTAPGILAGTSASNIVSAYKTVLTGAWTNTGGKTIWPPMFSYEF